MPRSYKIIFTLLLFYSLIQAKVNANKYEVGNLSKLNQFINFAPIANKTCKDSVFAISATSSSGLPVSFSVLSGNVFIKNNIVSILGVGTVIIQASQLGDDTYEPAPTVNNTFEITSPFYSDANAEFSISVDTSFCQGDSLKFKVTTIAGITNIWNSPNGTSSRASQWSIPNLNSTHSGVYSLKVVDTKCMLINQNYNVHVHNNPLVSLTGVFSEITLKDSSIQLTGIPLGGYYSGDGMFDNKFSPTVAGIGVHSIVYNYKDSFNCKGNAKLEIEVKAVVPDTLAVTVVGLNIKVFELITSRQSSKHKTWLIENIENHPNNEVFVFNNWGIMVYNKKSYRNDAGWDAEGLACGEYVYIVKTNSDNQLVKGLLYIDK